jgi:D-alanyl-D-alanine carboxypeptidase/D-alanyl-D-alanine-endopeptidase (penicillin-binding protein 4)
MRTLVALLCSLAAAVAAAQSMPAPVAQALARVGVPQSAVALYVQEVNSPQPSVAHNAARAMNPASAIKLVTTFAALDLLGPTYAWKTEAYVLGRMEGDVLHGDLLLKGYGDPKLTIENFWLFLSGVRARGVREIRGDLVLDRSYFDVSTHDPAQFDREPLRPYNVGADALLVNFQAVRFHFLPNDAAKSVTVMPEPRLAQLEVQNEVKLANGPCGDWRTGLRFDFRPNGTMTRVRFTGSLPASCGDRVWNLVLFPQPQYVHGVFRALWEQLGGTLRGGVREGAAPADAKPLARFESPSAAELLRDMNKFSNNVMARNVYLTLAAETTKLPGTYARAAQAVREWSAARKLEMPELVLENGSGLSRNDRISAQSLGHLLIAAYRSPVMPEFVSTMPLVAYDGTMKKRMKLDDVAGQAHIKTGSLADVRSAAGYVLDRQGHRHAIVFIVNHANAGATEGAQEAFLRWVHASAPHGPRVGAPGRQH